MLDLSNPEVVDYLYGRLERVLSSANIAYVKWDMNRSLADVYSRSAPPELQGRVWHAYVLGLYELYDRVTRRFPDVLFESCCGGGGRFDAGKLAFAPQAWTSDNTDAVERLRIQWGTSLAYPVSSMGSHVSASPNHQLFRETPLKTRSDVAYFGTFGYELDATRLTQGEREQVRAQVAFMKEHRALIQLGDQYRLRSPFEGDGNECAWMVVSAEKDEAIVAYYRILQQINVGRRALRLAGLDPDARYEVREEGVPAAPGAMGLRYRRPLTGSELMRVGLDLTDESAGKLSSGRGDFLSRVFTLRRAGA